MLVSCHDGRPSEFCIINGFRLGRWNVADGLEQSPMIEPVDPFECGHFDGLQVTPRPESMDHFGRHCQVDGKPALE